MRALLVDFDGLVIDSETPDFEAWRGVYLHYGLTLPRAEWVSRIGSDGSGFDPLAKRLEQLSDSVDVDALQASRRQRRDQLLFPMPPLPGVIDWLESARAAGLRVAIVSSSPYPWVDGLPRRAGLQSHFDDFITAEHVERTESPRPFARACAVWPYPDR